MSGFFAILTVLLCAIAAGLLGWFVQVRVQAHHRKAHQEYGNIVFLQLGVVFAVLLAFVFNSCWSGYTDAEQAMDLECGALHAASMIASTLPDDQAKPILGDVSVYIRSVITREWPEMRTHRRESTRTDDEMVRLLRAVAGLPDVDGRQIEARGQVLQLLEEAHTHRATRIFQAAEGVPAALWVILIGFSTVLVAFVSLSGIEQKAIAIAFTATFATAVVSIFVLAHLLDYPFEGALALSPGDFQAVLEKVNGLLASA